MIRLPVGLLGLQMMTRSVSVVIASMRSDSAVFSLPDSPLSLIHIFYMNNMRAMMQEQVFASDVVIFNRTDDDTDRGHLRRTIKNINRKAQIVYERKDGTIDEMCIRDRRKAGQFTYQ